MLNQAGVSGFAGTIVGRTGQLTALEAHAAAAREGRPGLVIVTGASGMGKTHLLTAFLAGRPCRGMTVLRGTCSESARDERYAGTRALFGTLGLTDAAVPDHPLLDGAARHALPALRHFVAGSAYSILNGLYRLAVNLTADRPLALVLDDAHHADAPSLQWLDFLLRRAGRLPLLVVLAQCPEARPRTADVIMQPPVSTVRLDPLTPAEVAGLARIAFGAPVAAPFAAQVAHFSGGNPRTATRLLRELHSEGTPPNAVNAPRVSTTGRRLIRQCVGELIERQPKPVREAAAAAAVLGTDSPLHLAALADVPLALVEDALAVLRRAEQMAPGRSELVHEAFRCAVLEPLGTDRLAALRTRAAQLLSDAGRPAEEIARHLLLVPGPPLPWMTRLLRDAATAAEDRGATETVARCLHRVLEAEPENAHVRLQLAASLTETDPMQALDLLRQGNAEAADDRVRARFAVQYAMTCIVLRRPGLAVSALADSTRSLPGAPGPGTDGRADGELHELVRSTRRMAEDACRTTATAAARERGDRTPQLLHCHREALSATLAALDGRPAHQAVEHARRVTAAAHPAPSGWPLVTSAIALGLADETDEALTALDTVLRNTASGGAAWTRAQALAVRAAVLYSTGAIPDAMSEAGAAVRVVAGAGWRARVPLPYLILAAGLIDHGDHEQAERLLVRMHLPAPDGRSPEHPLYLMIRARARWAAGDDDTALRLLLACSRAEDEAGVANPVLVPWWVDACHLLAAMNRSGEARDIAANAGERARLWGTARALGLAGLACGVITPGRPGAEQLTEAVARLAVSPARVDSARAELALGRALLGLGDHRGARGHLRSAAGTARRCGALAVARAARRHLIAAGGRMQEITASRADDLTGTERTVAGLASAGASNREIAESLAVTVRTVETHLTSIYCKLGVDRRTALAPVLQSSGTTGGRTPVRIP